MESQDDELLNRGAVPGAIAPPPACITGKGPGTQTTRCVTVFPVNERKNTSDTKLYRKLMSMLAGSIENIRLLLIKTSKTQEKAPARFRVVTDITRR